jgi:hypothetical protein
MPTIHDPAAGQPAEALATIQRPLDQTIKWMVEGNRAADITEALAQSFPGADAQALIGQANDYFATLSGADKDVIHGWCLESLREMYRRMVQIGDFPGALRAVKLLLDYSTR